MGRFSAAGWSCLQSEMFCDIMTVNVLGVSQLADTFTPSKRSQVMSRIGSRNTKPELLIRKGLHARGFRYRLHDRKLPGKPDMVFPRYKSIIFVNGCFWHGHSCPLFRWPATRVEYWKPKITRTIERDKANFRYLEAEGWRVLIIWECAFRGRTRLPIENVIEMASRWLLSKTGHLEIKGSDLV